MRLTGSLILVPLLAGGTKQLAARIQTLDMSGRAVETVVPAEYGGGFLERIGDIVVTDRGIWVIDWGQDKVLRFGPDGEPIVEYGRRGSGPAEYMSIERIKVDTILIVEDPAQGREVLFGLDGKHLETRATRRIRNRVGASIPVWSSALLNSGTTVLEGKTYTVYPYTEQSEPLKHIMLAYPDRTTQDTVFSYHSGVAPWVDGNRAGAMDVPFGAGGAWGLLGDTAIVLADGVAGTISIVKAGSRSFDADTLDLGVVPRPVSSRDIARLRAEKGLSRSARMPDLPDHWSVATRVIVDERGELWLRQAVEGDQQHWLVVTLDTNSKWRVILPERFELKAVHAGYLYGVAKDQLDVESVGALNHPRTPGRP